MMGCHLSTLAASDPHRKAHRFIAPICLTTYDWPATSAWATTLR